jgi:hypothetical protein
MRKEKSLAVSALTCLLYLPTTVPFKVDSRTQVQVAVI